MNLETSITNFLPEMFGNRKCLSAQDFWREMEHRLGEELIGAEVYTAVIEIYKKGILDTRDGCYYLQKQKVVRDKDYLNIPSDTIISKIKRTQGEKDGRT